MMYFKVASSSSFCSTIVSNSYYHHLLSFILLMKALVAFASVNRWLLKPVDVIIKAEKSSWVGFS